MPVDSDSLGSYLRQERERQRVSLQDIAAATKIQLRFLEALENDAYDQLPASPFVVGFLRAYAQYIALDPAMVLTAYRSLQRTPEPLDVAQRPVSVPSPAPPPVHRRRPHRTRLMRLGLFLVVCGLLTGLVVYELRRGHEERSSVASFPAVLPALTEDAPGAVSPVVPPEPPAAPAVLRPGPSVPAPAAVSTPSAAPQRGEQGPRRVALTASEAASLPTASPASVSLPPRNGGDADHPGLLVLQARAVEDTWLRVEIDGDKRYSLLLTSGKSVQWEASDRFRLTIGNVRGTRLALNGQEIALQSGRSNVMRDFLLTRALLH